MWLASIDNTTYLACHHVLRYCLLKVIVNKTRISNTPPPGSYGTSPYHQLVLTDVPHPQPFFSFSTKQVSHTSHSTHKLHLPCAWKIIDPFVKCLISQNNVVCGKIFFFFFFLLVLEYIRVTPWSSCMRQSRCND